VLVLSEGREKEAGRRRQGSQLAGLAALGRRAGRAKPGGGVGAVDGDRQLPAHHVTPPAPDLAMPRLRSPHLVVPNPDGMDDVVEAKIMETYMMGIGVPSIAWYLPTVASAPPLP
jgi:hypothetical protein